MQQLPEVSCPVWLVIELYLLDNKNIFLPLRDMLVFPGEFLRTLASHNRQLGQRPTTGGQPPSTPCLAVTLKTFVASTGISLSALHLTLEATDDCLKLYFGGKMPEFVT